METRNIFKILIIAGAVFFLTFMGRMYENLDADEIMVIQTPFSGKLVWYTTPGMKWQGFGTVTKYPKRSSYQFQNQIRFNDGGHATLKGSIQYEYTVDESIMTNIHTKFRNHDNVEAQLIKTIVDKSLYMTGPLMSSSESYSAKRNYLISYAEDQISHGVYKTNQKDVKTKDLITNSDKTATITEIVLNDDGSFARQEEAVLKMFGIRTFNFSISEVEYDKSVNEQIKQQQDAIMAVQLSMANAKKAEQDALTIAKQGEATATKSKWDQEAVKATEVTKAQQRKEVAQLDAEAAELEKKRQISLGQGESERKKLVMFADGALEQKLAAWKEVNMAYATAIKEYKGNWVPQFMMGETQGGKNNGAEALMQMFTAKTARDLSLDLHIPDRK